MKTCTKCNETKDLSEFGKNNSRASGLMDMCRSCKKSKYANQKRPPYTKAQKAKAKDRYKNNKADILAKEKIYRENMTPEQKARKNERNRKSYHANKEQSAKTMKAWQHKNRDKIRASGMKRYAAKKQRTVAWADDSLIAVYYAQAQQLEDATGIKFHIDHIIPLQGELVSGLHHQDNLQILTAFENMSKNNKYEVQ